jgi:hypothetical protein
MDSESIFYNELKNYNSLSKIDIYLKYNPMKSRYLAAQNIKYAFPKLGDKTSVPEYIAKHKIHAGPFLWIAREGHYEYTHFDPDEGCLMIVQGLCSNLFKKGWPSGQKSTNLG